MTKAKMATEIPAAIKHPLSRTASLVDINKEQVMAALRAKGTGSIFRPKGTRFWWVAYHSGGRRHYESTKSTRKGDAQALLTSKLGDTQRGFVVTPKVGKKTLGDGLKAVVDNLRMNGKKSVMCLRCRTPCCGIEGHTHDAQQRIDHLLKHFPTDRRMSTIATDDIEAYKANRIDQQAKPATVNRELAVLRRAYRLAMRAGALAAMPYVGLLEEDNTRQGFFERAEFNAILKHLPTYLHAPLEFMYTTGWRKSEVFSLTTAQVDLDQRIIRLEVGTTKSGDGRTFVMTEALHTLLKKRVAAINALKKRGTICPWVFHRPDGSRIKSFRGAWDTATDAAGYPSKLLHDFRRTAVRNLERAGVARSSAMKMVGHATEAIYRRYAIQDEVMLREASAKLEAWTDEQTSKGEAREKGQLKHFKRRKAS